MSDLVMLTEYRLTARAEVGDLKRMKVHALQQASINFKVNNITAAKDAADGQARRESLVDEMNAEWRWTSSRLKQESTLLKVIPNTYSAPRDGRGGGGWLLPSSGLLSLGREKLVSADPQDPTRVRRDISVDLYGFGADTAKRDLAAMAPKKKRTSSTRSETKVDIKAEARAPARTYPKPAPVPVAAPPPAPPRHTIVPEPLIQAPPPSSRPPPPQSAPRNSYAAAPASASYAYQPTGTAERRPDPPSYTPPMPLYHGAAKGDPNYLSWEEYRAYAKHDAWGCPLPHDNHRRDLVLRESWEKHLGRVPRESVPITPFGARSRGLPSSSSMAPTNGSSLTPASNGGRTMAASSSSSLAGQQAQLQQQPRSMPLNGHGHPPSYGLGLGQSSTSHLSGAGGSSINRDRERDINRTSSSLSQSDANIRMRMEEEDRIRRLKEQDWAREDRAREERLREERLRDERIRDERIKIEREKARVAERYAIPPYRGLGLGGFGGGLGGGFGGGLGGGLGGSLGGGGLGGSLGGSSGSGVGGGLGGGSSRDQSNGTGGSSGGRSWYVYR